MKVAIGISVLLVGFSVFYYLVIFLPKQSQQQLEQKLNSETIKIINNASSQAELESCLDEVNKRFSKALAVKTTGTISNEGAKLVINTVLEVVKQQKEECYKKYSQK